MIKPVGDRLLIQFKKIENKSVIITVTEGDHKKNEAVIVALGEGENLAKLKLKVGDTIMFEEWGGDELEQGDEKFKLIEHTKVLAIVYDDEKEAS